MVSQHILSKLYVTQSSTNFFATSSMHVHEYSENCPCLAKLSLRSSAKSSKSNSYELNKALKYEILRNCMKLYDFIDTQSTNITIKVDKKQRCIFLKILAL